MTAFISNSPPLTAWITWYQRANERDEFQKDSRNKPLQVRAALSLQCSDKNRIEPKLKDINRISAEQGLKSF